MLPKYQLDNCDYNYIIYTIEKEVQKIVALSLVAPDFTVIKKSL